MQYLDALEGLRSQGHPNEEVTLRRYEIMQRFIEGVRNFELKRNLALKYAPEQYVETPPTVEALRFTVQQYLRMRGSSRSDNYPMAPPQQQQANPQPNPSPAAPPPAQQQNTTTATTTASGLPTAATTASGLPTAATTASGPPETAPTASGLPTATPKGVFQLRRSIAHCRGLPVEIPRAEASATTGDFLSHEPLRRMDLPVTTAWLELRGLSSILTDTGHRSFLHQLWPHWTFGVRVHGTGANESWRANPCDVVRPCARSIRRPGPRRLAAGSGHLWWETNADHAGSTGAQLHRNAHLDTPASLGWTKVAPRADVGPAERGAV